MRCIFSKISSFWQRIRTPISSPSTSSTQIFDLYPGDRVIVRSYTPGSSWAYVQVQRSDISNTVGYVLVDAIK